MPRSERSSAQPTSGASAAQAFAFVLAQLERLADVMAAPPSADGHAAAELEEVVCGFVSQLRGAGLTPAEIAERLARVVRCASAHARDDQTTRARVAAAMMWCERAALAGEVARPA